ncbi:hypothetical protein [Pedobacter psychrophilus]|uniref:hypothetical protein n=1 Tax=Pedobacter psychrophilus TaxID=1826909 RepID=UPI0012FD49D1|nr:hypothetical protein [Pedobacter psychrophilus]
MASTQDSIIKSNPIVFADLSFGYSGGRAGGIGIGLETSYQFKNNLLSARYIGNSKIDNNGFISPFIPIPDLEARSTAEEFSLLYGYRKIKDGHSFSLSGGLSRNKYTFYGDGGNNPYKRDFYIGFPFEANIQFFNKRKRRIRLYGFIPIGKPTALGNGFGLKAFGNISRNSYAGLSLSFGFGYFKKY